MKSLEWTNASRLANRLVILVGVCIVVGALTSGPAGAGLLADCEDAMELWRGTRSSSHTYEGDKLDIDIDYAVFLPGAYPGAYPGEYPSVEDEYLYAYQVFNKDTSTLAVLLLTVGLFPESGADNIDEDVSAQQPGEPGGFSPDLMSIGTSSAKWGFGWSTGLELDPDEHSTVVVFTSPKGPTWNSSTITDGGLTVESGLLPSPVPEPGALSVLAMGAVLALLRRGRK